MPSWRTSSAAADERQYYCTGESRTLQQLCDRKHTATTLVHHLNERSSESEQKLKHQAEVAHMELLLFSLPRLPSFGGSDASRDSFPAPTMRASSRLSFRRVLESFAAMAGKLSMANPENSIESEQRANA